MKTQGLVLSDYFSTAGLYFQVFIKHSKSLLKSHRDINLGNKVNKKCIFKRKLHCVKGWIVQTEIYVHFDI